MMVIDDGKQPQRRGQRLQVLHGLQVLVHEEVRPGHDPTEDGHGDRRPEGAITEQAQVEHRYGQGPLPAHEQHTEDGTDGERGQLHRAGAVLHQLLEPVDDRQDSGQGEQGTDDVERPGVGVSVFRLLMCCGASSSARTTRQT
jgi:hypothetical protein